ncbi:MFS transporter [Dermacoccus barathri]|uniref:MFS transporter n=1 Tax=Dermacoccus barathri TaxID=322601 RepID=UPI0018794718|nr:MFS transporter [Dermacoccus barathri]MBE7371221.1 MFS transporter [Dermacoccus barathri]
MAATRYGRVLANPHTRLLLLLGFAVRVPMFGVAVILTLHVVETLHRTWSAAGLVAAVSTLAVAVSGPWRGKLLDRLGLRRVVGPSIVLTALCWTIAPFVGYVPLLMLAGVAGLFAVPVFTIVRQGVIAATSDEDRRTALAVDGIVVESAFMVGPILAIALATAFDTRWVIFGLEMVSAAASCLLWLADPPIRSAIAEEDATDAVLPRRAWLTPRFLVVCFVAFAAVLVLSGSDVSFVAAAKHFSQPEHLGLVLAASGLGSVIGGLTYGALPKAPPLFFLLFALAAATVPIGLASSMLTLALGAFLAGMFCAPTMTASVDAVARVVPERVRGEAMGWHGSFLTTGGALGGPIAGWAIDRHGFAGGFAAVGGLGALICAAGVLIVSGRRAQRSRSARRASAWVGE